MTQDSNRNFTLHFHSYNSTMDNVRNEKSLFKYLIKGLDENTPRHTCKKISTLIMIA